MGFLKGIALLTAAGLMLLASQVAAYAEAPEYKVKGAMLYKFAIFVEWPPSAFANGKSPFIVCVLGKDPFGPWLEQEVGEAHVGTHPVEIRHVDNAEAVGRDCHIVFVSASEEPRLEKTLPALRKGTSALIISDVGDTSQFCRLGGMIALVTEGAKVRFELNSKALAQAGLNVDSKLKRVAVSVDCGEAR